MNLGLEKVSSSGASSKGAGLPKAVSNIGANASYQEAVKTSTEQTETTQVQAIEESSKKASEFRPSNFGSDIGAQIAKTDKKLAEMESFHDRPDLSGMKDAGKAAANAANSAAMSKIIGGAMSSMASVGKDVAKGLEKMMAEKKANEENPDANAQINNEPEVQWDDLGAEEVS